MVRLKRILKQLIESWEMMEKFKELSLMVKKKSYSQTEFVERHSLMDILLFTSTTKISSRLIQIKKLFTILLKQGPLRLLTLMDYKYSNLATNRLKSTLLMELKRLCKFIFINFLASLMEQSNAFLLMEKKSLSLLMALFKELNLMASRLLSTHLDKKIFFTLTGLG